MGQPKWASAFSDISFVAAGLGAPAKSAVAARALPAHFAGC
jgi:hypothetical protein